MASRLVRRDCLFFIFIWQRFLL